MKTTANRLKILRQEKNLTESELSKQINVKEKKVKLWEKGVLQLRPKELLCLAKFYHVSSDFIIGLCEQREKSKNLEK